MRRLLVFALLIVATPALAQVTPGVGMYREDAAHADAHYGLFTLAVRRAIGSGLCGTDGDYCAMQVDANGALHVVFANTTIAVTNAGTFAVQAAQSGTWTVQPGNTANSTAWLVTGTGGTFPVTGTFWQATQPVSIAGTVTVSDGAGALTVDGTIACSNCSGSGASAVDDAAFAVATDSVAPLGGLFDDTAPDSVNEGDEGAVRMSGNRNLYTTLRDAAGNERGANVTAGNALVVDGSASTQPVSGTVTVTGVATAANQSTEITSLQLIDDAVSTTGSAVPAKGIQATGTDGTNARALRTDTGGELQVDVVNTPNVGTVTTVGTVATVTAVDTVFQVIPGTGSTDLGKAEDAASASGHTGLMTLMQRQDTPASTTSTDGDYQTLRGTDTGRLYTSSTVDAALPAGNNNIGDVDIASSALPSGASTSANQTTIIGHVDGVETTLSSISGNTGNMETLLGGIFADTATLSSSMRAEDSASANGNIGMAIFMQRQDTPASTTGTDGDYQTLRGTNAGRLYTSATVDAALPAGTNNIGDVDVLTMPTVTVTDGSGAMNVIVDSSALPSGAATETSVAASATSLAIIDDWDDGSDRVRVVGAAAEDAAPSGNPVSTGLEARIARKTAMTTEGDTVRAAGDLYGRTSVLGVAVTPAFVQATASGNTALVAAPSSGSKLRVFRVECSNSHATVAVTVGIRFGAAGTIFAKRYLPALGGAMVTTFGGHYLEGGDAEALNVNLSAGSTTIECTAYTETVDVS